MKGLSWLLQEADEPSCYLSLHSTLPGTKGSPMLMAAWSSLPKNFWKQSSSGAQGTTTPPKLTTRCSNQPHRRGAEGSRSLSIPQCGNTCLASRPARRIRWEWTKGTHTQSTHMELRAPVIKPGTSASFSGCLRVQIIRLRPAVPFSLFTLYAPIASATVAFPEYFIRQITKRGGVSFSLFWWGIGEVVKRKVLLRGHLTRLLQISKQAFATSEERFAFSLKFWSYNLQTLTLVLKMQPSTARLHVQEHLLLYGHI